MLQLGGELSGLHEVFMSTCRLLHQSVHVRGEHTVSHRLLERLAGSPVFQVLSTCCHASETPPHERRSYSFSSRFSSTLTRSCGCGWKPSPLRQDHRANQEQAGRQCVTGLVIGRLWCSPPHLRSHGGLCVAATAAVRSCEAVQGRQPRAHLYRYAAGSCSDRASRSTTGSPSAAAMWRSAVLRAAIQLFQSSCLLCPGGSRSADSPQAGQSRAP